MEQEKPDENITFVRYEVRGGNTVAVFDRGLFTLPEERQFCLDRPNLEIRIGHMKKDGFPCTVSEAALANWPAEGTVS